MNEKEKVPFDVKHPIIFKSILPTLFLVLYIIVFFVVNKTRKQSVVDSLAQAYCITVWILLFPLIVTMP